MSAPWSAQESAVQIGSGQWSPTPTTTARHLPNALSNLDTTTTQLVKELEALANRLSPVLRPMPPTPSTTTGQTPAVPSAPLGELLDEQVRRLRRMIALVESLMERLEV